jgi:hypothetical protein
MKAPMLLFVKARVRRETLPEFGRKLAAGEFGPSPVAWTFCLAEDPAVGLSLWEVASMADFEARFALQRPYYDDLLEVREVVTAPEAMRRLMTR